MDLLPILSAAREFIAVLAVTLPEERKDSAITPINLLLPVPATPVTNTFSPGDIFLKISVCSS